MKEPCAHQWSEATDTCRTCNGTDLGLMEIESNPSGQGYFKIKSEPIYGDYCFTCDDFTMVSEAFHCQHCGEVDWLATMDEEIFGQ